MQVVVDDILTTYYSVGQGKETIVILHGWQRSSEEWLDFANKLKNNYKIILVDLPGFGLTARPIKSYDIFDYSSFIEKFLKKISTGKVTVIGHSFGGRIAIVLAAKHQCINKMILVDSGGIENKNIYMKVKAFIFSAIGLIIPAVLKEKLRSKFGSADYRSAKKMRDIFLKIIYQDLRYLLKKISIPTYIIWGENDRVLPVWQTKIFKQSIPHSHIHIIWGAGHSPHLDNPNYFFNTIRECIDE